MRPTTGMPLYEARSCFSGPGSPRDRKFLCLDVDAEAICGGGPGERVGEVTLSCGAGDERQLDPGDLREILEVGGGELGAEDGVVGTACSEPALRRCGEVRHRAPYGARDRKLGHRVRDRDDLDLVGDEAQPVTQVAQAEGDADARRGIEDQPYGIG